MGRAAGHADDRDACLALPVPPQIVGHTHGTGRISGHRVDTAVGRAGSDRDDRGGLGRQPVEPLAGGHRLPGRRIVAEPAPVALVVQLLVRDGSLDDQHERFEFTPVGLEEPFEEVVRTPVWSAFEIDQGPVHGDLRQPGERAKRDLLDAGLRGGSQRHRISVTTQARIDPQNMDQGFFRFDCCLSWHMSQLSGPGLGVPIATSDVGVRKTNAGSGFTPVRLSCQRIVGTCQRLPKRLPAKRSSRTIAEHPHLLSRTTAKY